MTPDILSLILFLIFSFLGGIHFYWLFGGTFGLENVIPTKLNQENSLQIPKIATLIVALVLVSFGLLYLVKSEVIIIILPVWITNFAYWFIPIIFIIRAIGDFNYVGVFKRVKNTKFAKADSTLFIPLCAVIGIVGVFIQIMT